MDHLVAGTADPSHLVGLSVVIVVAFDLFLWKSNATLFAAVGLFDCTSPHGCIQQSPGPSLQPLPLWIWLNGSPFVRTIVERCVTLRAALEPPHLAAGPDLANVKARLIQSIAAIDTDPCHDSLLSMGASGHRSFMAY